MQHLRTGNAKSARESLMVRRIRFALPNHWKEYMDARFKRFFGGNWKRKGSVSYYGNLGCILNKFKIPAV